MINHRRHRRAIERLYADRCMISRHGPVKKPSGETRHELQQVYTDQPCRISQKSLNGNGQTEAQNDIRYETKLFIAPELEIKQGDTIEVTRHGRAITYTSGEPFLYGSHQEVVLERSGRA